MKKALTFVLALVMLLSLSIGAFATNATTMGSYSGEVTGTYEANTTGTGGTVYSVDIVWDSLSFTYHPATVKDWNTDTHQYDGETRDAYWEGVGSIKLTNHSNAMVLATPSYTNTDNYNISFSFGNSGGKPLLGSAEPVGDATTGEAQSLTIYAIPGGTLPVGTDNAVIGNVTLELSEYTTTVTKSIVESLDGNMTAISVDIDNAYYECVDDPSSLASGTKYILSSAYNTAKTAVENATYVASDFNSGEATQEELDLAYAQAAARVYEIAVYTKP